MNFLFDYEKNSTKLNKFFNDYIGLEKIHQSKYKLADQGEPKFLPNTEPYQGPWGRPQNDGPALRAISITKFGFYLSRQDIRSLEQIYKSELPATTPLKIDLEFISHQWNQPDFDLWEEVHGTHFFTRVVQATALEEGAKFATLRNDFKASEWYAKQALEIQTQLKQFWDTPKDYVVSTVNQVGGRQEKVSKLDSSIILASFFRPAGQPWSILDTKIVKTFFKLTETFKQLYPLNQTNTSTLS